MRQADLDDLRSQLFQLVNGRTHRLLDLRLYAFGKILAGYANSQTPNVARQRRFEVGYGLVERSAVASIVAGRSLEHGGAIGHGPAESAYLIQR